MSTVRRGRFAPTPSGLLHIGNARTALLSWLQIRSAGGTMVMRMEDIDEPRSKPEFARQILDDLRWLGLDWDEGPDLGGPHEPYVQSARKELYEEALQRLQRQELLYPCFCSRSRIAAIASAPHGLASEGPVYPGICRDLTPEERREKAKAKHPSLRFKLPDRPVVFEDLMAGTQTFAAGAGGDFVVRRADGIIAYQLAVVVDDAAMGITDVLRGRDLLDSTPRKILLYEALGHEPPRFAHVPLIHGADGRRLSKRHHSIHLTEMRKAGIASERIVGYLAFWSGLLDRPESVKPHELIETFDLAAIPGETLVLTEDKLRPLLKEL